ncbi:hypothetical protein SARI_00852 [Salmonella enterica subsp. arizonae serovar 62:z4,z23:-]|uniref:Uncharacterized protein n=1 Tax=Salmonella arizonae (strain ATCC BAA-731 / CDC346-86 / RSK2980) TaxID=41514 RepID=A9MLQ8_SALAR|nr:hypothetical protein SARI_00852 [Salmonella enterica subsp. arizonae serovar 62:z4,z23:-]
MLRYDNLLSHQIHFLSEMIQIQTLSKIGNSKILLFISMEGENSHLSAGGKPAV